MTLSSSKFVYIFEGYSVFRTWDGRCSQHRPGTPRCDVVTPETLLTPEGVGILESLSRSCWRLTFFKVLCLGTSPPLRAPYVKGMRRACREEVDAEHSVVYSSIFEWMRALVPKFLFTSRLVLHFSSPWAKA